MTTQSDDAAASPSPRSAPRAAPRVRMALCTLGILVILLGAVPGVRWWHQRRTEQFKSACVAATQSELWERLGLIAERWIQWDPSADDAHVYRAESLFQAGRLEDAAESLARVSNDYHGAVAALTFRGEILYGDLHRPYEAEATWQRILEIDPQNTHAYQRLISFYALSLQRGRMIQQIRECLRRRCEPPEAYAYLLLANALGFTEGLVHVRNWRKHRPDDEILEVAEAIYQAKYQIRPTIVDAFEASDFAPGDQSAINACLQKYPHNIEVLAYHLERQIFYGDTAEVVRLLKSAPAEAMQDSRFWRYRGWLLLQSRDYEQSIEALTKSLEIDRFSWRSRWEMAAVLRQIGRIDDAAELQKLAMEGKVLQDRLYATDGRALTWGLVEEMRRYISQVDEPEMLAALDARIRKLGGAHALQELTGADDSHRGHETATGLTESP